MTDWIKHDTDLAEQAYQQWVDEGMQGHDVIGVGEIAARLAREAIQHLIDAARLEGIRLGLEAASGEGTKWFGSLSYDAQGILANIQALDPETIARKAQDMGSEKETT